MESPHASSRIAKFIARASSYSRRQVEQLIIDKKVTLNGNIVTTPVTFVTDTDTITVEGKPLHKTPVAQLWKFYKPAKIITSKKDQKGRQTIYDVLPKKLQYLTYVGRLDYMSEGLLLLTNDGQLAENLTHPKHALKRTYKVRVHGKLDEKKLKKISNPITIDGVSYNKATIKTLKTGNHNHWLQITLTEGKNREIRKRLAYIDLEVNRLIRTHFHTISLADMKPGEVSEVKDFEL